MTRQRADPDDIAGYRNATQFDDLADLEEENRRLKRLLAIRLRQENLQLQTMLRRFGDY